MAIAVNGLQKYHEVKNSFIDLGLGFASQLFSMSKFLTVQR
jgi:hypothetical protein